MNHNNAMTDETPAETRAIDSRLTDLEVKATYTEDLLEQLEKVIIRQQQQIESLGRQLEELKQATHQQGTGAPLSLREELPPHF